MREKDLYESLDVVYASLEDDESREEFMSLVRDLTNPTPWIDARAVVQRWTRDHVRTELSALESDELQMRVVDDA